MSNLIDLPNNTTTTNVQKRSKKQDKFNNACINNNVDKVDLLIYYDNDLNWQEGFEIACSRNNREVIDYLLHHDYEYRTINLKAGYNIALKHNNTDLSTYLQEYDSRIND